MTFHRTLSRLAPGHINLHRHTGAYATLVRRGNYVEAAVGGRMRARPATLILHPAFHLHSDIVLDAGLVRNIDLGHRAVGRWRALRGRSIEALAGYASSPSVCDVLGAAGEADEISFEPLPAWLGDVSQLDAARFSDIERDISREHAHRSFKRHFGMTPGAYRRERQIHAAIHAIGAGETLANAAAGAGFSDQSHMTRLFRQELRCTPANLRDQITPVQDGG